MTDQGPRVSATIQSSRATSGRERSGKIGARGLHFHDLRHTGNTLAASTKSSLQDLMARMGHDSPAAAIIYQPGTAEADREIARAVSDAIKAVQGRAERNDDRGDDGDAAVQVDREASALVGIAVLTKARRMRAGDGVLPQDIPDWSLKS